MNPYLTRPACWRRLWRWLQSGTTLRVSGDWLTRYASRTVRDEEWFLPDQGHDYGLGSPGPFWTPPVKADDQP